MITWKNIKSYSMIPTELGQSFIGPGLEILSGLAYSRYFKNCSLYILSYFSRVQRALCSIKPCSLYHSGCCATFWLVERTLILPVSRSKYRYPSAFPKSRLPDNLSGPEGQPHLGRFGYAFSPVESQVDL